MARFGSAPARSARDARSDRPGSALVHAGGTGAPVRADADPRLVRVLRPLGRGVAWIRRNVRHGSSASPASMRICSAPDRFLADVDLRDGDVLEPAIAPLPGGDGGDARAIPGTKPGLYPRCRACETFLRNFSGALPTDSCDRPHRFHCTKASNVGRLRKARACDEGPDATSRRRPHPVARRSKLRRRDDVLGGDAREIPPCARRLPPRASAPHGRRYRRSPRCAPCLRTHPVALPCWQRRATRPSLPTVACRSGSR